MMQNFLDFCDRQKRGKNVRKLWRSYQCSLSGKTQTTYEKCDDLKVTFKSIGLATTITTQCTNANNNHTHTTTCKPEKSNVEDKRSDASDTFALNLKIVLAGIASGGSHEMCDHFTKLLGLPFVSVKTYRRLEDTLGKTLRRVSEMSMNIALQEEKSATTET